MSYTRPRLAIYLGSLGAYAHLKRVLETIEARDRGRGAMYFMEHTNPTLNDILGFKNLDIELADCEVSHGIVLEDGGFYFQPMVYEHPIEGAINVIDKSDEGRLFFRHSDSSVKSMGFGYSLKRALYSGYGEDMMVIFLSGRGKDGCDALDYVKKKGSHVLVQDPESTNIRELPDSAIREAERIELEHKVLHPYEIGPEVGRFLSSG
jgi:hypothetical protein